MQKGVGKRIVSGKIILALLYDQQNSVIVVSQLFFLTQHPSCCPLLHEELQEAAHGSSPLSEQPCTNPAQIILRREALQSSLPVFSLMGHPLPKHRSNYFTKISAISTGLFFLSKNKLVTLYKRNITHFGKKASIKQK